VIDSRDYAASSGCTDCAAAQVTTVAVCFGPYFGQCSGRGECIMIVKGGLGYDMGCVDVQCEMGRMIVNRNALVNDYCWILDNGYWILDTRC
jgi:hypothetical protein